MSRLPGLDGCPGGGARRRWDARRPRRGDRGRLPARAERRRRARVVGRRAGLRVGPPLTVLLPTHGVPPDRLDEAVAAYRACYLPEGLHRATPYEGVADVLWDYGSRPELEAAGADVLLEHPRQLLELLPG